jgi:hypothetical protein
MTNIKGWFDYSEFYDFIVDQFDNAVFVEVGTWKGQSIKYLAEKVKAKNKNIIIYGVDTFEGTPGEHDEDDNVKNGTLLQAYLDNIKSVSKNIKTIKGLSEFASQEFENESLDFVFIDADHQYESVKKDIELWLPKIKIGGIISGHDYAFGGYCGVIPAVNEKFKDVSRMCSSVWYYKKIQ